MIRIGAFTFPAGRTAVSQALIEAKSKVRREIRIEALLRRQNAAALAEELAGLQQAVEQFDRGQAVLSLQDGRYHEGRRREFQVTPLESKAIAWIELLILTSDRYERSLTEYQLTQETENGPALFTLQNRGNWRAPLAFTLIPQGEISSVRIETEPAAFELHRTVTAGQQLRIDSNRRLVTVDEISVIHAGNEVFPYLTEGMQSVTVRSTPADVPVRCTVSHRSYWI
jgi:phage-related protein